MKKTISALMALAFLFAMLHTVSAATDNHVFADPITQTAENETVVIPVQIERNAGFMGFAIQVTYDATVFTPVSVQKGAVLSGMFDNSIGYGNVGSFRVVYSGSDECTQNGELFTLTFTINAAIDNDQTETIGLTYSKQDTFNEQWQDVTLNCEDIQVMLKGKASEPESEPTSEPEESTTVPVVEPQPEKKLSERLTDWYESRPVVIRVLLWIFVKPLIRIIAATE